MLSGKYRRGEASPDGARLQQKEGKENLHFSEPVMDVVDAVRAIASEKGCTPGQFALAWCGALPFQHRIF